MKKIAVLNDIQFPHEDKRALGVALTLCEEIGVDSVILNGDIADCTPISDFIKAPVDRRGLQREIDLVGNLVEGLRKSVTADITWIDGNHEDRWRKLLWNTPGLSDLKALSFDQVFPLKELEVKWLPYGGHVDVGKLMVTHGENYGVYAARANFQRYGQSVLTGHTHRLAMYYQTTRTGPHVSVENGCLCRLEPNWAHHPNWQHGFSIVLLDDSGRFQVQQVPILKSRVAYWGDKKVEVK